MCRQGPGAEDDCDGPVPQRGLPPPLGRVPHRAGRRAAQGRVGKKPFFFLNPAQWVRFGFFVFFWVFWVFWVFCFLLYICPEERVFRFFSVLRILLGASRL
jgi:hypothetical protein